MKIGRSIIGSAAFLVLSITVVNANEWVSGDVGRITEFGGYSGGGAGLEVEVNNRAWSGDSGGCNTGKFKNVEGVQSVNDQIKNRMLSVILSSKMSSRKISLYVDTTETGTCSVQSVRMED